MFKVLHYVVREEVLYIFQPDTVLHGVHVSSNAE